MREGLKTNWALGTAPRKVSRMVQRDLYMDDSENSEKHRTEMVAFTILKR